MLQAKAKLTDESELNNNNFKKNAAGVKLSWDNRSLLLLTWVSKQSDLLKVCLACVLEIERRIAEAPLNRGNHDKVVF